MKRLVILGAGESGIGTAILAKQQGYDVFVSDGGSIKENYRAELTSNKIEFEEATHTEAKILNGLSEKLKCASFVFVFEEVEPFSS